MKKEVNKKFIFVSLIFILLLSLSAFAAYDSGWIQFTTKFGQIGAGCTQCGGSCGNTATYCCGNSCTAANFGLSTIHLRNSGTWGFLAQSDVNGVRVSLSREGGIEKTHNIPSAGNYYLFLRSGLDGSIASEDNIYLGIGTYGVNPQLRTDLGGGMNDCVVKSSYFLSAGNNNVWVYGPGYTTSSAIYSYKIADCIPDTTGLVYCNDNTAVTPNCCTNLNAVFAGNVGDNNPWNDEYSLKNSDDSAISSYTSSACCDDANSCVWGATCYAQGDSHLTGYTNDKKIFCWDTSASINGASWLDCDGDSAVHCESTCGYPSGSKTDSGESSSHGGYSGGSADGIECCGDDSNEFVITTGSNTACCDNPNNLVGSDGMCYDELCDGIDNDGNGECEDDTPCTSNANCVGIGGGICYLIDEGCNSCQNDDWFTVTDGLSEYCFDFRHEINIADAITNCQEYDAILATYLDGETEDDIIEIINKYNDISAKQPLYNGLYKHLLVQSECTAFRNYFGSNCGIKDYDSTDSDSLYNNDKYACINTNLFCADPGGSATVLGFGSCNYMDCSVEGLVHIGDSPHNGRLEDGGYGGAVCEINSKEFCWLPTTTNTIENGYGDEDDNGESDYDTQSPNLTDSKAHGDEACTVKITDISINTTICEDFNIICNSSIMGVNSIIAYVDLADDIFCNFSYWENNQSIFYCNVTDNPLMTFNTDYNFICAVNGSISYQDGNNLTTFARLIDCYPEEICWVPTSTSIPMPTTLYYGDEDINLFSDYDNRDGKVGDPLCLVNVTSVNFFKIN